MLHSAQAQSCGNGPRHLVYALVYFREYKKDLILICIMSQLRTVFFFVFALFELLTLSVGMQNSIGTMALGSTTQVTWAHVGGATVPWPTALGL